eukprot:1400573-Pleurochrysis_carterae.AAC.1
MKRAAGRSWARRTSGGGWFSRPKSLWAAVCCASSCLPAHTCVCRRSAVSRGRGGAVLTLDTQGPVQGEQEGEGGAARHRENA